MLQVAPSLLSANWLNLQNSVRQVEESGADWLHIDVMDGHFVPNISMGPDIARAVIQTSSLPAEVHLMVETPELLLDSFIEVRPRAISVHVESSYHLHRLLQRIQAGGCLAGVALNPGTDWANLRPVLPILDYVLVMTVNPGFGGQPFIAEMLPKIGALRQALDETRPSIPIWVDGGVGLANAARLKEAGANILVTGSSFFKAEDKATFVRELKAL